MAATDEGILRRLLEGLDQAAARLERLGGKPLGERDTKQVPHEYRHQGPGRPVDDALLLSRVPQLFVEAKGYGENLSDRRWAGQAAEAWAGASRDGGYST